ncbi:hypothetical protein BDV98DRAFT_81183 [Pterulicium gracile]|uniref:Uncharacterized protein n=1 Tax=Pterulicium gracile TaxID=1884261 RepID=A0A5C3QJV6_9AGAR|nr:hypothetical protein BDV98DRAFT_81183 [Pterula gracilis]
MILSAEDLGENHLADRGRLVDVLLLHESTWRPTFPLVGLTTSLYIHFRLHSPYAKYKAHLSNLRAGRQPIAMHSNFRTQSRIDCPSTQSRVDRNISIGIPDKSLWMAGNLFVTPLKPLCFLLFQLPDAAVFVLMGCRAVQPFVLPFNYFTSVVLSTVFPSTRKCPYNLRCEGDTAYILTHPALKYYTGTSFPS